MSAVVSFSAMRRSSCGAAREIDSAVGDLGADDYVAKPPWPASYWRASPGC